MKNKASEVRKQQLNEREAVSMSNHKFSKYLDGWIPKHKDEIISTLLELIAIPSTEQPAKESMPFGPEVDRAFRSFLAKAQDFGLSTRNIDGYAVHAELGAGEQMAMALTHIDIVPFGTGWTRNPKGEIHNGKIFGRGAQDNKGPTVACLYALKAIKDSGLPLTRRIRHVVGGNEETGFRCVRHYFKVEEQPTYGFSPDACFPLVYAEKGSMNVRVSVTVKPGAVSLVEVSGGERPNIVPQKAHGVLAVPEGQETAVVNHLKSYIPQVKKQVGGPGPVSFDFTVVPGSISIECQGKACHASVPWEGTNAVAAILHLAASLEKSLGSWECIKFAAEAADIYGRGLNIECEDDVSGKLSCNLGVCKTSEDSGNKVLTAIYNIRYPVKQPREKLRARALACRTPETGDVKVEVMSLGKSHYSDPNSFLVQTLLKVYREETGDCSPPITIGGGTYAKVIPGGVAYGPVMPGAPETAHQADEFISIDDLLLLVKIYARAMYELAR